MQQYCCGSTYKIHKKTQKYLHEEILMQVKIYSQSIYSHSQAMRFITVIDVLPDFPKTNYLAVKTNG